MNKSPMTIDAPAPLDFRHEEGVFEEHVLGRMLQALTRKSPRLFFRARDLISTMPQVSGKHEPAIAALIERLAENGHGGYLLDIGANIGLSSCQSGRRFGFVHMYEPNPLCANILEVNAAIALDPSRCAVHRYGLGDGDRTVPLTVPKDNWGGAFIRDSGNSYDETVLARKDGFERVDASNYFDVDIHVKDTATELREVFRELGSRDLRRGVIKIDVEGYEPVVLRGIAKALPADFTAMIVLESWDPRLNMAAILGLFGGRASAYKLYKRMPWKDHWPRIVKWACLALNAKISTVLAVNDGADWSGDIVLMVD